MVAELSREWLTGERAVAISLAEEEGGDVEVGCSVGRVDVLTETEIVEVKHVSRWLEASKVLIYAIEFPKHKPRVHLYGLYNKQFQTMIETKLKELGIGVTWQSEPTQ
jgi:hypothetical protein